MPIVKKPPRRNQVTCYCNSYKFPHRVAIENCTGVEWCNNYYKYQKSEACEFCNANNNGVCEVATGKESFSVCEGYIEHLESDPIIRYPIDEQEYYEYAYSQQEDKFGPDS